MLLELYIRNIALIEELHIPFEGGLNILTGETGAGKSIVVDSVCLILGGRANRDLIRTGTEKACVQAAFDISDSPKAKERLEQFGIDTEDNIAAIARELSKNGQNLCRINGNLCTLSQLREVSALLMDIHGQSEHQKLLEPAAQLSLIDEYGDEEHRQLLTEAENAYKMYAEARKAYQNAEVNTAERERLLDMLHFQIAEIDEAKLKDGELEKLEAKAKLYENAELISDKIGAAYAYTYAGAGRSISAQESIKKAADALSAVSQYNSRFEELRSRLEESYFTVQDIGLELQDIQDNLDYDPAKLARIEDRIDVLNKVLRKYGPTEKDAIAFRANAAQQLDSIENADAHKEEARKRLEEADAVFTDICEKLTASRKELAEVFCKKVCIELAELGMPKLRMEARFEQRDKKTRSANGADNIDILISPNPGEPLKSMSTIASGGELARIMLAIKTVQNTNGGAATMVFDEIDTGVSGIMAQAVGEKLLRIGLKRQVICVTHLPQIAAMGEHQYLVAKHEESGRTRTNVTLLDEAGRISELSRLVGGADDNGSAAAYSANMLRQAEKRREELR